MQQNYPPISVLIPVHNRLKFCIEAIRSVLNQSYRQFEIVLIDDGSQLDLYFWICHYFDKELLSGKLRYHYQANKGVSSARNSGIRKAQYDLLALLDSDDLWQKEKLKKQVELLQQENAKIIHTDEEWLHNGKYLKQKKKHLKPSGNIFFNCLEFCRVAPSSVLMHRDVFENCGFFDEELPVCEDYDMWLRLSLRYEFHLLSEPLVIKRGGHRNQLSFSEWGLDRFRIKSLIKLLRNEKLTNEQYTEATSMLKQKLAYVINGAKKRENLETVREFEELRKEYGY